MIMRFLFSICILWCTTSFATSLDDNLVRLDAETLNTELWALNCVMVAQKSKLITNDCYSADKSVQAIDQQLMKLIDELTTDSELQSAVFYSAMDKIKHFRIRLLKINNNLSLAKKITGVYNWTDKVYPSYYKQR